MTTYPTREIVLNIIAAGGWEYVERSDGLCCLRTPKGLEYLLPSWRGEPPHYVAWEYYTELNSKTE